MADFASEDDAVFPSELVGRPTSDVLRYLADTFEEFAQDTEEMGELCTGYVYAAGWLHNWETDAKKVEDERRRKAR